MSKTLSTYPLEKSEIFHVSMQEICSSIFNRKTCDNFLNVHHLSELKFVQRSWNVRASINWGIITRNLYFCIISCKLDSRYFSFLLVVLSRPLLSCTSQTFSSLFSLIKILNNKNHFILYFLAKNYDLNFLGTIFWMFWSLSPIIQWKSHNFKSLKHFDMFWNAYNGICRRTCIQLWKLYITKV